MTNIYILRLAGGNYYVGKTENVAQRYQQHLDGKGAAWTRRHRPVSLERVIENASPFDEDKYVKEMMAKVGIEKVRGGAYVTEVLDPNDYDALQKEIWGATNCCTRCGRNNHFVKDCSARMDVSGNQIEEEDDEDDLWGCEHCDALFETEAAAERHERCCSKRPVARPTPVRSSGTASRTSKPAQPTGSCYRCGRTGHYSNKCYARTHKNGYDLSDDDYSSDSDYE